jgi:probable phosphoglycerate mutase
MRLILIRHGQTPANVNGVIQSAAPGPGLTELGIRQAESLPAALALEQIESISVSKLSRTHLTAAPLAAATGLTPVERPGLHEIEAGDTEGETSREAIRAYLTPMQAWADGNLDAAVPGAYDGHHFYARFDADVAAIAAEGWQVAAIVSHGAALRAWVGGRGINIDPHFAVEHDLDNTGVVIMEGSPAEGWTLISWQGEPVGGPALEDEDADDPTGEVIESR